MIRLQVSARGCSVASIMYAMFACTGETVGACIIETRKIVTANMKVAVVGGRAYQYYTIELDIYVVKYTYFITNF